MPLIKSKSKEAFKKNLKAEEEAGKPKAQSLAIAYATQRHSKRKKMAYGGAARNDGNSGTPARKPDDMRLPEHEYMGVDATYGNPPARKPDDMRPPKDRYMANHFAEGGDVDEHYDSIADAIVRKKHKAVADSQVDLAANSEEKPNYYDELNEMTANAEQYDVDQLSPQPRNSNEIGDEREDEESDKHDMVSQIRRKMRSKKA